MWYIYILSEFSVKPGGGARRKGSKMIKVRGLGKTVSFSVIGDHFSRLVLLFCCMASVFESSWTLISWGDHFISETFTIFCLSCRII